MDTAFYLNHLSSFRGTLYGGFFLGNSLPDVLNNPRAFFDILRCEQSFPCNERRADPDTNFHGLLTLYTV